MRTRPYFNDTYAGIVLIGVAGAAICGLVSGVMFLFRSLCEPILRIALTGFVEVVAHSTYRYDPSTYYLWAGYAGFLGLFILLIAAVAIIRKPAVDRRIDESLRRQTTEFASGAPLEPK
ncbi:MAG TPA: hypothetical protein VFK19_12300 [Sphingomicrobium sp.]|nr:hypothetical protein [Sphingomicrobium sp.]